jgi:hypothetical protein
LSPAPSREKEDCAGELGWLDPWLAMLASVEVRSRPEAQFVENTEGPKGLRCGIEPALNLDNKARLFAVDELWSPISPRDGEGDLKGLGAGDGLEVFAISEGRGPRPLLTPPGEKRDGTVPARALLVVDGRLSGVGSCVKSGNPSVGDSGIFSRRGVELPLVGGPQTLTGTPSCACISRAL